MAKTVDPLDLLICHTCGTQFDVPFSHPLPNCKICDDPRQYVPPTGQKWTSLGAEHGQHKNIWTLLSIQLNSNSSRSQPVSPEETSSIVPDDRQIWSIETQPKLGIGERCILIQTPNGNLLWDLITHLDDETISWIKSIGGLAGIVISHPHYYTTHLEWAEAFDCPIYISSEDEEWVSREDKNGRRKLLMNETEEVLPGITAIKVGGHFPGSLVLHYDKKLFVADSLVTIPVSLTLISIMMHSRSTELTTIQSALYHINRPGGTTSFTFMFSIPNMIPLPPSEMLKMWQAMKPFEFVETHGAFTGQDVFDPNVKGRVLESMKIQALNATGTSEHELFEEKWP